MSKSYVNGKWCVRCGRTSPTPYLVKNINTFEEICIGSWIVDVGCGNCRNSNYLNSIGFVSIPIDSVGDFGIECSVGNENLPFVAGSIKGFLLNYVLMFLSESERNNLYNDIWRCANKECVIMVELYPSKDIYTPTKESMLDLMEE